MLQVKYVISRRRCDFGAPISLSDRPTTEVVDCVSFEDDNFICMKEIDKGIQVSKKRTLWGSVLFEDFESYFHLKF